MDHDNLQVPVQCTDESCDLPCVEGEDTGHGRRNLKSSGRPFNDVDQNSSVPSQASGGRTSRDREELRSSVRPFTAGDQNPSVPSQASGGLTIQDQEELQRLKWERTCKVCLEEWVHVVFDPCGHLVCEECSSKLPSCPLCRGEIQQRWNISSS